MAENLILLIDPFKNLILSYRMILEEENYVVEASRNIKEAFNHLAKCNYFIIITESFTPHEEIHRLIHWVKKNVPETYLIILTRADINYTTYEKLLEMGIDDIILKPCSPEKVLAHIRKGLRQRNLIIKKQELEHHSLLDPTPQKVQQFMCHSLFFKKCIRQELKRAKRHHHPFSLIFIKIPTEEEMGDRFESLRLELLKIIRKCLREEDLVAKNNGEIGLLLPETGQTESKFLIKRLLDLIQTHPSFKSEEILNPIIQNLSFQTFTYPDYFFIPESLKTELEELT